MKYDMKVGVACNLCGECVDVCITNALSVRDGVLTHNSNVCAFCELCMDVCGEYTIRISIIDE